MGRLESSLESLRSRVQLGSGLDETELETGKRTLEKLGLPKTEHQFHGNQLDIAANYAKQPDCQTSKAKWAALFHLRHVQSRLNAWLKRRTCSPAESASGQPESTAARSCCCSPGPNHGNSPEMGE
jgi:hypothetical protein